MSRPRPVRAVLLGLGLGAAALAADAYRPVDTQTSGRPLPAAEAIGRLRVPEGFKLTLAAAEPAVRQPIAIAYDDRGRLWVAESFSYNGSDFTDEKRDRIVIFDDRDGDGVFESRRVFHDGLSRLTGLALGFGGVWVTTAPTVSFIPDRDGDDVPDGAPVVRLDGWTLEAEHNTVNGLAWGPDGWLYGRHGIKQPSRPGRPGVPPEARREVSCSIWRYHPVSERFEVVVEGSVNPWGLDWDEHGQLFMGTSVVDHLWHVVPGAQFKRTLAAQETSPYPHLYELMGAANDHSHRTLIGAKGSTGAAEDPAAGGHAHAEAMIYLGDRWPAEYRGSVFMSNIHGRRVNRDRLVRASADRPYAASHAPDFLIADDPWFRAVSLRYGPDGDVVMTDWVDNGECHDRDGVHRSSGRIYKLSWGEPRRVAVDIARASLGELVAHQRHPNDWFVRHARRRLQERAAAGENLASAHSALREMFAGAKTTALRLRALWALFVTGAAEPAWLAQCLSDRDEHVRFWAVRLLVDGGRVTGEAAETLIDRAAVESAWLPLMALASALPALEPDARWRLGAALARALRPDGDPNLGRLLWIGWQETVAARARDSLALAAELRAPKFAGWIARRIAEEARHRADAVALLLETLRHADATVATTVLRGMADGMPQLDTPVGTDLAAGLAAWFDHDDRALRESATKAGARLRVPAALDRLRAILREERTGAAGVEAALAALTSVQPSWLAADLLALLARGRFADPVLKALATCDDPRIAPAVLAAWPELGRAARATAINTLLARPASLHSLLDALAAGRLEPQDITHAQARQVARVASPEQKKRFETLWGNVNVSTSAVAAQMRRLRATMKPDFLALGDLARGRAHFEQRCAACHTLFGKGGAMGPELTGSGRKEIEYLITNIVDPNAAIPADWRLAVATTDDGRVVSGAVAQESETSVTLRTPEGPVTLPRRQLKTLERMGTSLMPAGLLDDLPPDDIRDLFAYLMSDEGRTAHR